MEDFKGELLLFATVSKAAIRSHSSSFLLQMVLFLKVLSCPLLSFDLDRTKFVTGTEYTGECLTSFVSIIDQKHGSLGLSDDILFLNGNQYMF